MKTVISIITITLLVALYLFWHFENRRKRKAVEHHEKRQEEFDNLIKTIKESNPAEKE